MSHVLSRLAAGAALMLAACGGGSENAGTVETPPASLEAEASEVDPWVLIIESGRWGVLISRAREGAMLKSGADVAREETDVQRIESSLRFAALDLIRLRDVVCAEGVVEAGDPACAPIQLPYWVLAAPDYSVSLDDLQARSDWISEASGRLVEIGCAAGDEATGQSSEDGPPSFCMVE